MENKRAVFSEELDMLRRDILAMASLVEEGLGKALAAFKENDRELAQTVREGDAAVNAMQLKIEDDVVMLIATQQPVARDLREIFTILKITVNLERAGDHAVHLAKTAMKLSGKTSFRAMDRLELMVKTGQEMIRASTSAYLKQDPDAARKAAALDDIIDGEHKKISEEMLRLMKGHPELLKKAFRFLHTSGDIERLGDHVTNICEAIIYMTESKHEELNE
ncbi:MAG: phosphate signaling complex protein PhoU [Spirochaetaceae bacterium]|jgi:phosphate transport system protein|nr:phosphate signaling complex protein PhoU [Spirochaetaceae bacterium]